MSKSVIIVNNVCNIDFRFSQSIYYGSCFMNRSLITLRRLKTVTRWIVTNGLITHSNTIYVILVWYASVIVAKYRFSVLSRLKRLFIKDCANFAIDTFIFVQAYLFERLNYPLIKHVSDVIFHTNVIHLVCMYVRLVPVLFR